MPIIRINTVRGLQAINNTTKAGLKAFTVDASATIALFSILVDIKEIVDKQGNGTIAEAAVVVAKILWKQCGTVKPKSLLIFMKCSSLTLSLIAAGISVASGRGVGWITIVAEISKDLVREFEK